MEDPNKFRARYERSVAASRLQNRPHLTFPTDRPQVLHGGALADGFSYNIAEYQDVVVLEHEHFLPVLVQEKLALFEHLVGGPAWVQQGPDFRLEDCFVEVDLSQVGMTVQEPCVLVGGWCVWYHWLLNFLPRVFVMELAKPYYPDMASYKVAVPHGIVERAGFLECLRALGINRDRILDLNNHSVVRFKDLLIPNIFSNSLHSAAAIRFLSHSIRRFFLGDDYASVRSDRRTYVSRDGGNRFSRRVVNNHEIDAVFREFGFDIVRMEELSLSDQVETMNKSSIVVGTHGSGLTNLIFAKRGTRFMEIGGFQRSMFSDLADLLGITPRTLLLPAGSYDQHPNFVHAHWQDYIIDPSLLRSALQDLCA